MRVTVFQFDVAWMNLTTNLSKISSLCENLAGKTDLIILPEMFTTGYTMKPEEIPTNWENDTIQALTELCKQYDLIISGSIPTCKDGGYFNSFIFIKHTGLIHKYDKIHLFTLAGEKEAYKPGISTTSFQIKDFAVQALVCYDLRFPYASYAHSEKELLLYSANWPSTRVDHWQILLVARAIENQCFVIGVNRTGSDENGYEYPGASMIIDYNGKIMVQMDDKEGFVTINLDFNNLSSFRTKLPFLKDRVQ